MSGTDLITELLTKSASVIAAVPANRIKGGSLAPDIPLNALLIREVTSVDRQQLKQGAVVHTVERISVTVRAKSWRDQRAIIRLVRAACVGDRHIELPGITKVSVRTAGRGPDMTGPGQSFEQTQDFRVTFDAIV
ncbi:hypothetical protein [Sphingomonas mucosissima]|uniref:DUF3168 domain-containing protein n=1 Tax=Sphingomonas mucosissima TaxID=370959 RepID=A0A245ZRC6_9SPHN|nr:hypothetical protein [Sphingomonas mucosissima]OWK32295.1 hypothetical protein SPMU_06170 [Sphingomonas mucosissima]